MVKGPILSRAEFEAEIAKYEVIIDPKIQPGMKKLVVNFSEGMQPTLAVREKIEALYTTGEDMWASASWEEKYHHRSNGTDSDYHYWELTLTAK
jgi:hypothetical protein